MADREDLIPQDPETIKRYENPLLQSALEKYGPQGDASNLTPEEMRILKDHMEKRTLERFKEREMQKPKGQMVARGGKVKRYAKGGHIKQYSNSPRKPKLK